MRVAAVLALLITLVTPTAGSAQSVRRTVVITASAPIFATPNDGQPPLRVAREGSVLLLVDSRADWYYVEFEDPQLGRRAGYVQHRYGRLGMTDLASRSATGTADQDGGAPRPVIATPSVPLPPALSAPVSAQRGDVALGYVFVRSEDGVSLPLGIAVSDAWRVHPNVDLLIESQYAHGTIDLLVANVGANIWTGLGGVRFWGGSRYGESTRAFGQVLAGVVQAKATAGSVASVSFVGLGVQPGFGVEVPVARAVAIRPQFDLLVSHLAEQTGYDMRFNVNVVFRLFRSGE